MNAASLKSIVENQFAVPPGDEGVHFNFVLSSGKSPICGWQRCENQLDIQQPVQEQIQRALQFIDTGFYDTTQGFFLNP